MYLAVKTAEIVNLELARNLFKVVLPEAVVEGADGFLSVNYGGAALVAAIELAKVVEELRAEIAELKAK